MDNNLPNQNDPPSPVGVTPPQTPVPEVPITPSPAPTGAGPNPPNNTVDPVQSWVAQHEQRDVSGKFVKSDHQASPNSPNIPDNLNPAPDGAGLFEPPVSELQEKKDVTTLIFLKSLSSVNTASKANSLYKTYEVASVKEIL